MNQCPSEILVLDLQFPSLQPAQQQDGFHAQKIRFSVLVKFLENKNPKGQLLPDNLKQFYIECRAEFVKIRQTPADLETSNEKAIKFLEDSKANNRIAPQLKCEVKPLLFGHHALQIAAATAADQKIKALITPFESQCQDEAVTARKDLRQSIAVFNIQAECEKLAIQKWVKLCGGDGATNLYDRNYIIVHNVEASQEDLDSGSAAEVSMNITLSRAIASAAFHRSGQLAAIAEAAAAAKKAEEKKAREEALAKTTAAQAVVANRPSAESEESIKKRLTKEIKAEVKAECMKELRQDIKAGRLHLNPPAAQSQSTQRTTTANHNQGQSQGIGRGRGGHGQGKAGSNAGGQTPNQGRGRGGKAPAQDDPPPASNSRGRQRSRSPSQQRGLFQTPPPPKTPRTSAASSSSPRRSQSPSGNRGRGGKRGGKGKPRSPSPAAGRGGRGRGQAKKRGGSPYPRR
jgi:hypothetical protein